MKICGADFLCPYSTSCAYPLPDIHPHPSLFLSRTERRKKKGIVLIIPILLLAIKVTLSDTYSIKHFTYSPAVSGLQSKTARNTSVVQKVSLYPPHKRMCTLLNPGVSQQKHIRKDLLQDLCFGWVESSKGGLCCIGRLSESRDSSMTKYFNKPYLQGR